MARGQVPRQDLTPDQRQELEQLRAEFPEEPPSVVEEVLRTSVDRHACSYRLTCRENLRRDPGRVGVDTEFGVETGWRRRGWGLPSCPYCGKQQANNEEAMRQHLEQEHGPQEEYRLSLMTELRNWERKRNLPKWVEGRNRNSPAIGHVLMEQYVRPHAETAESYRRRMLVLTGVNELLDDFRPGCKVYLFGSGVSGIAESNSDVDMAAVIDGAPKCDAPAEEIEFLEDFYEQLMSTDAGHPWPRLRPGIEQPGEQPGLKSVMRTRVPIIQCVPVATARMEEMTGGDKPCTLLWPAPENQSDEAMEREREARQLERVEMHKGQHRLFFHGVHPNADGNGEIRALRAMLKEEGFRFAYPNDPGGVPLVYARQWDLSLRLYGVRNSHLLRRYFQNAPDARAAAIAVKMWSKAAGINDPRKGLLSSYAVTLMFLYYYLHLPMCNWVDPESVKLEDCVPALPFVGEGEPDATPETVGAIFCGFFHFYAVMFKWDNEVVTLSRGMKEDLKKWKNGVLAQELEWTSDYEVIVERAACVRYHLRIEDPYEAADCLPDGRPVKGNLNVARKITEHSMRFIQYRINRAYQRLCDAGDNGSPEVRDMLMNQLFQRRNR